MRSTLSIKVDVKADIAAILFRVVLLLAVLAS